MHIVSARSPQGPTCHPWAGQQDPCHPGVCREGRCLGWGGGCPPGPRAESECRVTLGKSLSFRGPVSSPVRWVAWGSRPHVGHPGEFGWYISPVCLCLQTCLFPGSWGCRGQLHPTDREAEVQWGEVTYFPGSWPFPSSSFLFAKVPLDAEAGPCRGLCYGAQSGGRELRVSGLRVKCSLDPRRRSTACWSWVLGACGSWSRTRSTPSSSTWR